MFDIKHIRCLPQNFDHFVEENAVGLRTLYGRQAEQEYRETIVPRLEATLPLDTVMTLAAFNGETATGMLLAGYRDTTAHIGFIHILADYQGQGIETALIENAVARLRDHGLEGITSECIAFCPLDDAQIYDDLGFTTLDRIVMTTHLPLRFHTAVPDVEVRAVTLRDRDAVGKIMVAAYENHPSRRLHGEIRTLAHAAAFVKTALLGGYGGTEAGFSLLAQSSLAQTSLAQSSDGPIGALIGCRVAPDVGFVLHVAVHPDHQAKGIGRLLLGEVAKRFATAGLTQIALGVTADNPARKLYERQGFLARHALRAHAWWRDGFE